MPLAPRQQPQRVAIYARYSSDPQCEALRADMVEVCRHYVGTRGWSIGEVYADHALRGASRFRPAFQRRRLDASARKFDLALGKDLGRFSRKLTDLAALHDQLSLSGIGLHTVATGEVTAMHVGMLETMAQM